MVDKTMSPDAQKVFVASRNTARLMGSELASPILKASTEKEYNTAIDNVIKSLRSLKL